MRYLLIILCLVLFSLITPIYGDIVFDEAYIDANLANAEGKKKRGLGLAVSGLIAAGVHTIIWTKVPDNPRRYTIPAVILSSASVAGTLHGAGSVIFADKDIRQLESFEKNMADPESIREMYDYHYFSRKKSAVKISIFAGYLAYTGILLGSQGLMIRKYNNRGESFTDKKWGWPFAFGVLMISGSGFLLIRTIQAYRQLDKEEKDNISVGVSLYFGPQGFGLNLVIR